MTTPHRRRAYISIPSAPERIGRIQILGTLGRWRGGWFHHGHDPVLGVDRLVKAVSPDSRDRDENCARLTREARIIAVLEHPNVISIYEFGYDNQLPYVAFELLNGEPLSHAMHRGISLRHGLPVILQVLAGLETIHDKGVVLRDLSPSGVLVCPDGRAVITDFSLAKPVSAEGRTNSAFGRTQPLYTAPEQVRGRDVDRRCDLFSVGCMIYQMAVGRPPFQAQAAAEVLFGIVALEPDLGGIPPGPGWERLRSIIRRALEQEPENRYPDSAAMRSELEVALEELGPDAEWLAPSALAPSVPAPN